MPIHGYPGNVITANPTAPTVSSASGVWTTEQQLQAMAAGNWPMAATQISRSLRFNSADSAYLNRTPASASNRRTWTWSGWVKKSVIAGDYPPLFNAGQSAPDTVLRFSDTDNLSAILENGGGGNSTLITTQVFRDPSAWYHIVWAVDTTNATANNRSRLYVNGTEITAFGTRTNPSQNFDTNVNNTVQHRIGGQRYASYFNGYITEINFVDGLALTPASFGNTNSSTGVWQPIQYTGPYGTNGFYLNFSDNSNTTAATLGKDSSGNGNNWTPNNFSVTAGSGNDSLLDSPTAYGTDTGVGGEVRGNYATLNPLQNRAADTFSDGNLRVVTSSSNYGTFTSTIAIPTTGKWYCEATIVATASYPAVGIVAIDSNFTTTSWIGSLNGVAYYGNSGQKFVNATGSAYGASYTTNDVIGIAYDADNATITFYKNNTSQGSITGVTARTYYFGGSEWDAASGTQVWNFGQRAFAYTAPSGFKALCTTNLPTPTIGATSTTQANDYFNPVLYTGDGTAIGSGGKTITGVGFQSDFTWIKCRSNSYNHRLIDSVRGAPLELQSNLTDAEVNRTEGLNNWTSDGFVVGNASGYNASAETFVAWNWNAGGSNATNTSGTITSTVRANTTSGFSIVTFTDPNNSSNYTVGHGLGVTPSMIIVKERGTTGSWLVWHSAATTTVNQYLLLNSTGATGTLTNVWGAAVPTSTVFGLKSGTSVDLGDTVVAYCFAAVAGYSAFGSYTGNGSNDGPFVYAGFRPRYVLIKRTDTGGAGFDWFIWDTARDTYNQMTSNLTADQNVAEGVTAYPLDALSNGFKVRNAGTAYNASGGTYIYAAFAESPFKYALAR